MPELRRHAHDRRRVVATGALVTIGSLVMAGCGARVGPYLGTGQGTGVGAAAPGAAGPAPPSSSPGAPAVASGPTVGSGGSVAGNVGTPASSGIAGTPGTVAGVSGSSGSTRSSGTKGSEGSSRPPAATPPGQATTAVSGSGDTLAALSPANFPYQPSAQAALCTGTAGNTASDTGVTPTTITLGNVSGITGVLADNFQQGPEGVQALFSAVNAAGGICGRKLELEVEDDGQSASTNAADIANEIPKVFAFVGSTSDADNGGVQEMVNADIPDIGAAINPDRGVAPVNWSTDGATVYDVNGHPYLYNTLANGLKAAGNFPTKVAVLSYSVPISASAAQEFANMLAGSGASLCFTDYSISPATASLDQDVLEMKLKGCNGVFTTLDVSGNAKLLESMGRQDWHPEFEGTTFDGYTPAMISVPGQADAQGFEMNLPFLPLNDNNPIVNLYLSQLSTYEPGQQPSGFGIEAWASAQMFIYALVKAGRNPTRASLTAAFQAIDSWDTGGATVPITPRLRRPSGPCTVAVEVKGNDFQRVWPASGFYCSGQLVQVG